MRALHTLMILLISGILGSTIATQYPADIEELLCRRRFQESNSFGDPDLYCSQNSQTPANEVETFLRKKCEENGSELSYDNAKDGLKFFTDCLQSVTDVKKFKLDFTVAKSKGQLRNVYKTYCLRTPLLKECVKYATGQFRSCLKEPDERKTAEIINNIASSFLEFICYNDGERIARFVNATGQSCLASKELVLTNCAKQALENYIPAPIYRGATVWKLGRLAEPLIPSGEDCAKLNDLQDCAIKSLAECRDERLSNLLNATFDSIRKETICQDWADVEEPEATGIWASNFTSGYNVSQEQGNFTSLVDFVKEKCEQNGGPAAFQAAIKAPQYLANCIESLVNVSLSEAGIANNGTTDRLDTVLTAYCRKVPILKSCLRRATWSVKDCLKPEEQESVGVFHNVMNSLLRFVCRRHANHLIKFVSSGGTQCVFSKKKALLNCGKQIFYTDPVTERFEGKIGLISAQDCIDLKTFQRCTVKVLKKCENPTPARTVKALIKHVFKKVQCKDLLRA